MNMNSQQDIWEQIAENWNSFRQNPLDFADEKAKEWIAGKILDIGCGNCRNLIPFAKAGFDCYGLDFSKKMIDIANLNLKKNNANAKLAVGKAEKLPYADESFSYCLMLRVLPEIDSSQGREDALNEMIRVLKKGGKAIITIWNKKNFKHWLSKKEVLVPWKVRSKDKTFMRYYYLYTPEEIRKILISRGLKILESNNTFKEEFYIIVQKI